MLAHLPPREKVRIRHCCVNLPHALDYGAHERDTAHALDVHAFRYTLHHLGNILRAFAGGNMLSTEKGYVSDDEYSHILRYDGATASA